MNFLRDNAETSKPRQVSTRKVVRLIPGRGVALQCHKQNAFLCRWCKEPLNYREQGLGELFVLFYGMIMSGYNLI